MTVPEKVKPVLWLPVSGKEERALTDVWGKADGRCALITLTGFDWNRISLRGLRRRCSPGERIFRDRRKHFWKS